MRVSNLRMISMSCSLGMFWRASAKLPEKKARLSSGHWSSGMDLWL